MKLKPLQGEYAQYLGIISRYNQKNSFLKDNRVEYWLQVGQALGLPAPHTDNHAGQSGGAGEGQKTQEEQGNFKNWKTANLQRLTSAQVEEGSASTSSGKVFSPEKQQQVKLEKDRGKMERKKEKKQAFCEENGHNFQYGFCLNCGQEQ